MYCVLASPVPSLLLPRLHLLPIPFSHPQSSSFLLGHVLGWRDTAHTCRILYHLPESPAENARAGISRQILLLGVPPSPRRTSLFPSAPRSSPPSVSQPLRPHAPIALSLHTRRSSGCAPLTHSPHLRTLSPLSLHSLFTLSPLSLHSLSTLSPLSPPLLLPCSLTPSPPCAPVPLAPCLCSHSPPPLLRPPPSQLSPPLAPVPHTCSPTRFPSFPHLSTILSRGRAAYIARAPPSTPHTTHAYVDEHHLYNIQIFSVAKYVH
jgi:hypothetical protein